MADSSPAGSRDIPEQELVDDPDCLGVLVPTRKASVLVNADLINIKRRSSGTAASV